MTAETAAPAVQAPAITDAPKTPETSLESLETLDGDLGPEPTEEKAPESKEPPKTEAQKTAEKKFLKSLKLKFNGKEMEEQLPFDLPDDPKAVEWMQKQLQMAKLGTHNAQNYSQLEKEVLAFVEDLRKNPKKALSNPKIGVDIKKLAADILEEEIANSQKTPEQIEKEKLEAELRELKESREKEKEEMRQKNLERLQEQEFQRYDMLMDKAFKDANVAKNPFMVKRMADYLILGLENGKRLDPADVLPLVQEEMMGDLKEMFAQMPAESLKELIGKDNMEKIRKHNISQSKKAPPTPKVSETGESIKKTQAKPVEKKSFKDFFGV